MKSLLHTLWLLIIMANEIVLSYSMPRGSTDWTKLATTVMQQGQDTGRSSWLQGGTSSTSAKRKISYPQSIGALDYSNDQPSLRSSSTGRGYRRQPEMDIETLVLRLDDDVKEVLQKHYGYQHYNDEQILALRKMIKAAQLERQQQIAALLVKLETLSSSLETLNSRSSTSTEQFVSQIAQTREGFKQELRDVLEVQDERWKAEKEAISLERESSIQALKSQLLKTIEKQVQDRFKTMIKNKSKNS